MPERKRRAAKANSGGPSSGAKGQAGSSSGGVQNRGLGSPAKTSPARTPRPARARTQQAIPDAVANRMARRIALATGLPTLLGMGVFIGSYVLVSRHLLDIPPSTTLLASGACFLLGLVGLSYGVLSASWEDRPGSLLGTEQIPLNLSRIKTSLRALREGAQGEGNTPS